MKKKITKILASALALLALLTLCVSCTSKDGYAPGMGGADIGDYEEINKENSFTGGTTDSGDVLDESRKIIKTVNESVQTEDYEGFLDQMNATVGALGGYVTSANYRGDTYYNRESLRYANVTVRIPAEKLSEFTERIEGISVVTSYTESVDDVTAAYVDVESRIAVLTAEEAALLEMLSAAETVSTALEIRTRLSAVQGDLASLKAQKNTYDTLVAYSTVHLNVSEVRRAESTDPTFFEEVGYNFSDSLDSIGQGLRAFAVWLLGDIIYIVIVAGLLAGAFFAGRYLLRRRRLAKGRTEAAVEAKPTEGSASEQSNEPTDGEKQ